MQMCTNLWSTSYHTSTKALKYDNCINEFNHLNALKNKGINYQIILIPI